jgi:glutamyl-tRNA(Gln) amidotransferase subunit D
VNEEDFTGYRGVAKSVLKQMNTRVWADVEVTSVRGKFIGTILPRDASLDDKFIVLKLRNGYDIGIKADTISNVKEYDYKKPNYKIPEKEFPYDNRKPDISLLGTCGTIAGWIDYRTGAVMPAFSPGELYSSVPELADICNLSTKKLFGILSENMGAEEYKILAKSIADEIKKGVQGVMIEHGTDTLHNTGAILSFMIQNPPVPIVILGSQRSPDRPSSDTTHNLLNSAKASAYCDIAEVMICMPGPTSDTCSLLHRGTRVKKMHSSYRSAFRTIGDIPLAIVEPDGFKYLRNDYNRRRTDTNLILKANFEEKVAIVHYYPNIQPDIIYSLIDNGYKGIIIAGTGLGHVNKPLYPALQKAIEKNILVFMTVQTIWGYVQMYTYGTGRDLLNIGVVPLNNMLPEVAYAKLSWALGTAGSLDEVRELMLTPIAGEMTQREQINGYAVLQGGLPEVDKFLAHHFQ